MPEISRFFGIIIRMYLSDHQPLHSHAMYGEDETIIEIKTQQVFRGTLSRRALALVMEWAALHQAELRYDWNLARSGYPLNRVAPLD